MAAAATTTAATQIADIKKLYYNLLAGFLCCFASHHHTKQLNLIISLVFPTGLFCSSSEWSFRWNNHRCWELYAFSKQWNYKVKSHKNAERKRPKRPSEQTIK